MSSLLAYSDKSSNSPITTPIHKIPNALNIDGVVNPETLNAHLSLLIKFKALEQNLLEKYSAKCEKDFIPVPPIESQKIWEEFTGTPWVLDANDKSNFTIVCP
ncbi:16969_t:CDS:2, partial [Racocetra fulgida]